MTVKVTRITSDPHTDQKWLVLKGEVEGVPEVTKVRSINVAALVSGDLTLEAEKAALVADVEEYLGRYNALQQALLSL
jgi:hypothetical protein